MTFRKFILSGAAALLLSQPVLAADAAPQSRSAPNDGSEAAGPLEEVVVSEFRRSAVLDVGASLSVFDAEEIESATLQHFEELIRLVPNMNYSGEGSRARYFQLRGVGELEQYEGAPNPSVGFIVDDIDLSGVGGVTPAFDMQQAEVLRGPQATRFGAAALAGVVYLQSAEPGPGLETEAEFKGGSDGTLAGGVAVGGPLAEGLSGRFSMHRYRSDGFYDNAYLGVDDSNERDEAHFRGKLLWEADGGWKIRLAALHADFDNGYDAWSPDNGRITYSDNPGRDEQRSSGASLKISGPLSPGVDFVGISAWAQSDVFFSYDGEWGNPEYWAPYGYDYIYSDRRDRRSLSQEFRLLSGPDGRLFDGHSDWVLGLYAQRLDESDAIVSAGLYDDSADAPWSYCPPCRDRTTLDSEYSADNLAVFGRLDSEIGARAVLKAGLRLERWSADYSDAFRDYVYGDPARPARNRFSPQETLWGGDLGLDVHLDERRLLYLLLSRGYKAGGFNPSLARVLGTPGATFGSAVLGAEAVAFDPEDLLNLELGLKGAWLEGDLNASVSLFWMQRGDMQLRSSAQFTDNPNDFVFITSNAEGHAYGLEASLAWDLDPAWRLHANLGLLRSEVDAYALDREADIPGSLVGRAFAHAPPYTLNLGATWTGASGWTGRVDYNAVGSYYFDYSHDEKAADYQVVNLKFGRDWARWGAYFWVRNLFDEAYHTRGFSFGLQPPLFPRERFTRLGDPRHYGVTVVFRY